MKAAGRVIICCYTGSDLRTRGVIPEIDAISHVNVSVEFDHRLLHPRLHHVFFPFDSRRFRPRPNVFPDRPLRIGHAPTSRAAKGSDQIIPILEKLGRERDIEIVLIEGVPYDAAIAMKGSCDLFVDQIGDLGYGINSLEALAMGIPAASCLAPGFAEAYPDHPFVVIDQDNLLQTLGRLLDDRGLCRKLSEQGEAWVRQYHDAKAIVRKIHHLAGL
jgi:glycosyltransferase involved in cell wall biosynthesis